jgi:arsenate reductase (thioredoxin)
MSDAAQHRAAGEFPNMDAKKEVKSPVRILVLCTGNSARSILGEHLLRHFGRGRFETFSAGSKPTGRINPLAMRVLREVYGLDASGARSKPADEFRGMPLDVVITVCDHAREACPVWPGVAVLAHWSSPDPAAVEGTDEEKYRAFVQVAAQIARRAELLAALPEEKLRDPAAVGAIGDAAKLEGEAGMKR